MSVRKGQTILAGLMDITEAIDSTSITKNSSAKIQANGTVDKNSGNVKYNWVGTLAEYEALNSYDNNWLYYITDDDTDNTVIKNVIGQIIQVNCTSDYIPDGCLPCDGSEYSRTQFSELWYNYLTASTPKLSTCSYSDYASSITTYGQCIKFAVDTTTYKFKTPTIKDGAYLTQALSDTELGKAYNESLPNITGAYNSHGLTDGTPTASGALYVGTGSSLLTAQSYTTYRTYNISLSASRSSSTYQDNAKVQGDNVRVRYFVVVANSYSNQSGIDWSEWQLSMQDKADKDLANTGVITNCLTNIPQDIKLELNDGTLTLKAGSKLYIPNGVNTFNTLVTTTDISMELGSAETRMSVLSENGTSFTSTIISNCISGSSAPTGTNRLIWYDTANNLVKVSEDGGSTWATTHYTLPYCIYSATTVSSTTQITSIDQVFNGFGYIGSTIFALPGVKGLIPNGRNANGSLKNTTFIVNTVKIATAASTEYEFDMVLYLNGEINTTNLQYSQYSIEENKYYAGSTKVQAMSFGKGHEGSNSYITSFTPKTCFHAIDYSTNHTVIEAYKNGNNWYRLWSDGWVEQGGIKTATTVTFLKPYKDTSYTVLCTNGINNSYYIIHADNVYSKTTTTFSSQYDAGYTVSNWYSCGYGA